jgi:RNA polymerase sigma-70 factor, ECF subfamily
MNSLAPYPIAGLTLEYLFRNYRNAVFNMCYAYTRSRDDAEDLVQETFVKAHLGLAGFEGRSHPKTWLLRIAINQSLTKVLANKRWQRNLNAYLENEAFENKQDRDAAPLSKLGAEEMLKRADVATRKVLLLSFQHGLTHSQIAKTLGVSRVAVTRRITRFKEQACVISANPRKPDKSKAMPASILVQNGNWTREPGAYQQAAESRLGAMVSA